MLAGGRAGRLAALGRDRAPRRRRRSPRRSRCPPRAWWRRPRCARRGRAAAPARAPPAPGSRPAVQHSSRGRDALAGRERDRARRRLEDSIVSVRISMPRPRSSRVANSARLGRDLRHHALARLDEHEARAHPCGSAGSGRSRRPRSPAARRCPPARRSRRPTKTKVRYSRRASSSGSDSAISRFQQRAVAHRDRVRQRLEAEAVLREAGHGQHARDRPERDDQLVVVEGLVAAVHGDDAELVAGRVGARHAAEPDVRPLELLAQRHHHVARLQRAGRGARAAAACRAGS